LAQFHVAIVDLHLSLDTPSSGIHVIKQLTDRMPELPVVAFTGDRDSADKAEECINAGAVQFVTKPVESAELVARVNQAAWIMRKQIMARSVERAEEQEAALAEEMFLRRNTFVGKMDLAYGYRPLRAVGGDYFDFITFPGEGRFILAIGDAIGHGVSAALHRNVVGGAIRAIAEITREKLSPDRTMELVNNVVSRSGASRAGMTLFLAVVDVQSGKLTYSSAGHPAPIILRARHTHLLELKGSELGLVEGALYSSAEWTLEPGDLLLLYTDGISELVVASDDGHDEMLEPDRLAEETRRIVNSLGFKDLPQRLFSRLEELTGGKGFHDDCTVITLHMQN
jgi:sigma-B regulation protein RsbU (phosphoserine phosphatase)